MLLLEGPGEGLEADLQHVVASRASVQTRPAQKVVLAASTSPLPAPQKAPASLMESHVASGLQHADASADLMHVGVLQ